MGEPKPLTAYQQTYHWRNKNCGPWAREWVKKNIPGIKADDGKQSVAVNEVTSVSGDCDLGLRKGKPLTIYDLEVSLLWTGTDSDGVEVKGTIKVPEVSHEAIDGLGEYVYEISITSPSPHTPSASSLASFIRSTLTPLLSEKFNSLRPALLEAHGAPDAPEAKSGTSTPGTTSYSPAPPSKDAPKPAAPAQAPKPKAALSGTKVVEVKAELQASANDIWGLLTDPSKIPMWSRAPAQFDTSPESPISLFGGNVTGKVVSADPPTKLVTTWQLKKSSWPSDHFATMTIGLEQGSSTTNVTFTLEGVPAGQEGEIEKALQSFYITGLKQMGLVVSFSSRLYTRSKARRKAKPKPKTWPTSSIIGGAMVFGLGAVLVGLVVLSFSR